MGVYINPNSRIDENDFHYLACALEKQNPDLLQALPKFAEKLGKYASEPSDNPLYESNNLTKEEKEIMFILILTPMCGRTIYDEKKGAQWRNKGCFRLASFEACKNEMSETSLISDTTWNILLLKWHIIISHNYINVGTDMGCTN